MEKRPLLTSDGSSVVTTTELTSEHLWGLFTNQICALRLQRYCPEETCSRLTRWALTQQRHTFRAWRDPGVDGARWYWGLGLHARHIQHGEREKYFRAAVPNIQRLRKALAPNLGPFDRLRLELDELWPQGAQLKSIDGYKYFVGLGSYFKPDGSYARFPARDGVVHTDSAFRLRPDQGEFGANFFLNVPPRNGEFIIWSVRPSDQDIQRNKDFFALLTKSYTTHRTDVEVQQRLRDALPKPNVIRPQKGEVIFFNSGRPHAVRGFDRGFRLSIQVLLQYRKNAPLELYV